MKSTLACAVFVGLFVPFCGETRLPVGHAHRLEDAKAELTPPSSVLK